jgi:uncharacterized protein (DUF1800 family)
MWVCFALGWWIARDPALGVRPFATNQTSAVSFSSQNPVRKNSPQAAGPSAAVGSVNVSPAKINLRAGANRNFFAQLDGGFHSPIVWRVDGVKGGNASVGTIDADGNFTAPEIPPANNVVEVEAVSVSRPDISGRAAVTILNPIPVIAAVNPTSLTYGEHPITIEGSGFVAGAEVRMNNLGLPTKFISSRRLTTTAKVAPTLGGRVAFTVFNPDPGNDTSLPAAAVVSPSNPKVSYLAAGRFLEQATWGPSAESISHLQEIGFEAWLAEQFAAPPTFFNASDSTADNLTDQQSEFFVHAIAGKDQLRQRVAFALGQIFVVSGLKTGQPRQMVPYQNMLLRDAFCTYANILRNVTLSPTMGVYLDMVNDDKGSAGISPNENYARELMQLFSIGTVGLNADGRETGRPTYDQSTITDMARALTGWTFPGKAITQGHNVESFSGPMIPVEANHDVGEKTIVGGVKLAAGQPAELDLREVLHVLSTHPNTAPFVSLRLIQHMVTSDPSAEYLKRVSAIFVTSGGDLKAVVRQILMDPEARAGDELGSEAYASRWPATAGGTPALRRTSVPNSLSNGGTPRSETPALRSGHLREPVLTMIAMMRSLGASVRPDNRLERFSTNMGQRLFYPESVFNDYSPLYRTADGWLAPEFELLSSGTALMRANVVRSLIEKGLNGDVQFDLSPLLALAASPSDLVDAVDRAFLYGRLPVALKPEIVAAVSATHDYNLRVRNAIYLVASSALYQVQH